MFLLVFIISLVSLDLVAQSTEVREKAVKLVYQDIENTVLNDENFFRKIAGDLLPKDSNAYISRLISRRRFLSEQLKELTRQEISVISDITDELKTLAPVRDYLIDQEVLLKELVKDIFINPNEEYLRELKSSRKLYEELKILDEMLVDKDINPELVSEQIANVNLLFSKLALTYRLSYLQAEEILTPRFKAHEMLKRVGYFGVLYLSGIYLNLALAESNFSYLNYLLLPVLVYNVSQIFMIERRSRKQSRDLQKVGQTLLRYMGNRLKKEKKDGHIFSKKILDDIEKRYSSDPLSALLKIHNLFFHLGALERKCALSFED